MSITAFVCIIGCVHISGIFLDIGFYIDPTVYKAAYMGLALVLLFLIFPATKKSPRDRLPWYDAVLAVISLIPTGYFVVFQEMILKVHMMNSSAEQYESVLAFLLMALVIEGARRTVGLPFAAIIAAFVLHLFLGRYIPGGILHVVAFPIGLVTQTLYVQPSGLAAIMGVAVNVMATVMIVFLIFGAFVESTGAGPFFINSVLSVLGKSRGGAAKTAVLGSGMVGAISGSGVANVGITGSLTIPLMKGRGYSPEYAAAAEAVASNGGQIMPPVMGAVSFLIAENLNIPYIAVCVAAVVPAVLYYVAVFIQIHLHAVKYDMKGLTSEELPSFRKTVKDGWIYLLPIGVLLFGMTTLHLSASRSCLWALVSLLIIASFSRKYRPGPKKLEKVISTLAPTIARVSAACAGAGVIIASLNYSGLGLKITSLLVALSGGNILVLLLFAAGASFILGMGTTSVPCYLVVALLVAPALINGGVLPIAAHLFAFWFGIVSFITPPVCITSFVAAGIADSHPMKTGVSSMRLGVATFLIPFVMCFNPSFVLQGSIGEAIVPIITVVAATFFLAAGVVGYMLKDLTWWERIISIAAAILLFIPVMPFINIIGGAIGVVFLVFQLLARRNIQSSQFASLE